jgi:FAD/FMN-containing dehydrogenase
LDSVIFDTVTSFRGSISAEHGVGQQKRHLLPALKSPGEFMLMKKVKALFDPENILNPGMTASRINVRIYLNWNLCRQDTFMI